jgi:hypothetical protein
VTEEVARAAARLALQPLLSQPANVRLAAVVMMLQSVVMTEVKAGRRMEFFDRMVDQMRGDLVADLKGKGVPDGKKGSDGRGDRSKASRKKARG